MNESEWFSSRDVQRLLEFVQTRPVATRRKLVLFGCGCVRTVWQLLVHGSRACVEVQESFVDGLATDREVAAAVDTACRTRDRLQEQSLEEVRATDYAATAAAWAAAGNFEGAATRSARAAAGSGPGVLQSYSR